MPMSDTQRQPQQVSDKPAANPTPQPPRASEPPAQRIGRLRQAMLDALQPEDFAAITRAMVEQAGQGNVAAAKLLFVYVFGKPGATADDEAPATPAAAAPPPSARV